MFHIDVIQDGDVTKVQKEILVDGQMYVDDAPREGSVHLVTSGGVNKAIADTKESVDEDVQDLQEQIDDIAEKAGSGYIPKGEADVATLNGLSGQENGWLYTMTDSGTLTDGSLAVSAGDTVAWDATNSVWYKAMDYAPRQYGTNEINNLPTSITAFRTGDVIPVDGPSGTAKMPKDDLLKETAENALGSIHSLSDTATETDLVAGNYFAIDGSAGTKKLPSELVAKRSVQNKLTEKIIEIDSPILSAEYTATANAYRDFWNRESPANEPLVIWADPTKVSSVIFCTMSYTENYEVAITEEITFVTLPVAKQMIRVYSVVSGDVKIKIEKKSNTSVLQNEIRISNLEQREVNCVKEYDLSKFSKIQGSYRTSNIYDGNSYDGDYKTIKNVPVVKGDFYRVEFKGETYSTIVSIIANMSGDTQIGTQIRGSSNDGVVTTATFKAQSDFISLSFPYNYIKLFHIGSCLTFDKIVLFGDSITEEWSASNGDYTNRISAKFNCNNVVKLGFGGYMLAGNSNKPLTEKVSLVISERPLQLVILLAGTNDYGDGTDLGTYQSAISDSGSACSGLKYIINEVMTKSDANFLYCNPIKRSGQSSAMTTYARELMKAVYQYKVDYPKFSDRIMVADLQTYFGLEPSLESSPSTRWYTTDGLHLNFVGYERLTDLEKEAVLLNLKGMYHI